MKSVASATLFLCVLAGCAGPSPAPNDLVEFSGNIMGTSYHIKVAALMSEQESAETASAIEDTLKRIDGKMSTYKPDSELSKLNTAPAGTPVPLSDETFKVFGLALDVNAQSDGAFDITVGPLVNAWGFGPDEPLTPPSDETLKRLAALTGRDKISLDNAAQTVTKAADGVYCDLSAIAKGYAVDMAAETIAGRGYENYMVEIGGEVRTAGQNSAGLPWHIAIEKPLDGERALEEVVGLSGISLATSGNYRNFYITDGKRMSHTIDPKTGRPVEHQLASVSVIYPDCALADAYATTIMVLGPEKGLAFAEERGLAVMLILHGAGEALITRQTPSFTQYVVKD